MGSVYQGDSAWKAVKIGAGGWLTGMDIAPDGTMVARTDTYGAFIWTGQAWKQLVTASSMPDHLVITHGVYELRISASSSNVMYMTLDDGIYKTVNKGESWTKTAFPIEDLDPNGPNRMDGQKMAIDLSNPDIVFAGTQKDGLWVTRDGGNEWHKVAAVPQGSNTKDPGLTGIVIDGSNVFVGTAGSGVYSSNDGGVSWKAIGGPADVSHAVIGPDGSYYASGNTDTALWKYSDGVWTKLINRDVHSIAIDPFDPAHIMVIQAGGALQESWDGGTSWGGWNWATKLESSADVPWLENSGLYMSTGAIVFDPLVEGKLWQSAGVGMWSASPPKKFGWGTPILWNSSSSGIEQLVANDILAPAGGSPIFASWDRPFFEVDNLDTYASSYGGGDFSMGWSIDYASSDPKFVVGISDWWGKENSGFSVDGGNSWQKFAGLPSWATTTVGGSIAASTTKNFIWVATGNQPPAYTLDGGESWTNISIPEIKDWSLVHHAYYLNRTAVTADRVAPNTFYLLDSNSGVYRTTDGGVSWEKVFKGQPGEWSYWNAKMEAVPGSLGELYFTSGPQGSDDVPSLMPFMHSTNGGASWQAIKGVEVLTFGYGAGQSSSGPATVYIVGKVDGDYGIFYSADGSKTWTKIGEQPLGSLDSIKTIAGDMDKFGLVYVGFAGSGFAYLDFSDPNKVTLPSTPPPPAVPTQVGVISDALDDVGATISVKSGAIVNDKTPTFSGTLSSGLADGQKLAIYRDGQIIGQVQPASTSWTFTDPGASDGKHDYAVRVLDAAGQVGRSSAIFSLSIDTAAPAQAVSVTGASSGTGNLAAATLTGTAGAQVTGTIAGALGADEMIVVFRDGVRVGEALAANGSWSFSDSVNSGSFRYTAQVQDAAGNAGQLSSAFTVSFGISKISGTTRNDNLVGTSGSDVISGLPESGNRLGRGGIDVLTGNGGDDIFVLGDARGRFYDDGSSRQAGLADFARITDFSAGDKLQLVGAASDYVQGWISNLGGFSGTGIYHDTNRNGVLDGRDELIALLENHGPVSQDSLTFFNNSVSSSAGLSSVSASNTVVLDGRYDINALVGQFGMVDSGVVI